MILGNSVWSDPQATTPPMKIKKLLLDNFRCFDRLEVQLAEKVNLLIGNNGSGKSTILDALSIGLGTISTHLPLVKGISIKMNDLRHINDQKMPYCRVHSASFNDVEWDVTRRKDKSAKVSQQIPQSKGLSKLKSYLDANVIDKYNASLDFEMPLFAYYGVSRAVLQPLNKKIIRRKLTRFDSLSGSLGTQSRFHTGFSWFYQKENEEQRLQKERKSFNVSLKELDVVRTAITTIFPDLTEPEIKMNPLRFTVRKDGEDFTLDQLSDGYKTMLGLIVDLGSRFATANPGLKNPLEADAVVMIDEIDLHLHPTWQQRVIGDMIRTFPRTQFILTTHSPYIVEALNNHLKKGKIETMGINDAEIAKIQPLRQKMVKAFVLEDRQLTSILDEDLGLIDDKLLHIFNDILEFSKNSSLTI